MANKVIFKIYFSENQKILEADSVSEILLYLTTSHFVEDIVKIEKIEDKEYLKDLNEDSIFYK